jgi:hypothetical protein
MADQNTRAESADTSYELSDISPNKILWFGLGLALLIVAVVLINYGLFQYFHRSETRRRLPPSPLSYGVEPPPEPRLVTRPGADLEEMRAEEDQILNSYGWIDRDRGIVRLPVDRAIELLAERGLPVRAGGGADDVARTKGDGKEKAKR